MPRINANDKGDSEMDSKFSGKQVEGLFDGKKFKSSEANASGSGDSDFSD